MPILNPADMPPREAYRLLTSIVVPRPIGWISTLGADGSLNLAPFSFFNAVGGAPPTVMFAAGQRQNRPKDSVRNAQETGAFVVNMVEERLAPAMNLSSGEYDYDVDEFVKAGLTPAPSDVVRPPRVAEAQVALECQVTQVVPVNDTQYTMVLGRVLRFHIAAGLLRPNGLIDPNLLKPIGRLGGDEYALLGPVFIMPRP